MRTEVLLTACDALQKFSLCITRLGSDAKNDFVPEAFLLLLLYCGVKSCGGFLIRLGFAFWCRVEILCDAELKLG